MSFKYTSAQIEEVKNYFKKNPNNSPNDFMRSHPKSKMAIGSVSLYATKVRKEIGFVSRKTPIQRNKKSRLYVPVWQKPLKAFENDPISAFESFLETLTNSRRALFELIKFDKRNPDNNAWETMLEVRESS